MMNIKAPGIPLLIPYEPTEFWREVRKIVSEEVTKGQNRKIDTIELTTVKGLTEKPLYKTTEICALFNITRTTVHEWVKVGKLRKVKVRSRVYFLGADIRKMIE